MPTAIGELLVWGPDGIEPGTIDQAANATTLPFVRRPMALMADAHVGIGATIGSVIATDGAVIPSAVGVDIGCGMIAARTEFNAARLPDSLGRLHGLIRHAVPAGVGEGHEHETVGQDWIARRPTRPAAFVVDEKLRRTAAKQLGSLGSGNHFVEICLDESDRVWILLHSGSRGVGNTLARMHIDRAKGLMRDVVLADPDLAYFLEGTDDFQAYIADMLWAQDYAWENRQRMLAAVLGALAESLAVPHAGVDRLVNCHHNYCTREVHAERAVWVTRKGAIRARADDYGIIPGSMATGSYIVRGLGNEASYCSASHGAGRRMSRGQAKKRITVDELNAQMAGKAWNDRDAQRLLDEAPAAYKPIEDVMAAQTDLVEVVHTLRQVLNYKGVK